MATSVQTLPTTLPTSSPTSTFQYVPKYQTPFKTSAVFQQKYNHIPTFRLPASASAASSIPGLANPALLQDFDGKRLRKAVVRKTVDYNAAVIRQLQNRVWQRDYRDHHVIQPDTSYYVDILPPPGMNHNPINSVTTKFVRTSTNKMRCPIFCLAWTPEGRRLVTGASSGEFTLWNGLTFNFETILQAHDAPVRAMQWSHNDTWMVTGDHAGFIKYWQSNMNNVRMYQAHKEPIRDISFCPTDQKFASCSDDGTVRIWDFLKCYEEKILRGHGSDVKSVAWHPQKCLLASGSKDSQQPVKLWDPRSGNSIGTLHVHKSTVMCVRWNANGNWLLTSSRDHLIKLFDIRKLNQEMQTFRGHKKEVSCVAWHPVHETLFASGGSDGAVMFWMAGSDKEVGVMEQAHDGIVWTIAWHPLGHILCTGSNDHTCKFWTRNRPGDKMRDKYNLNTLPTSLGEEGIEYDDASTANAAAVIPGMGLDSVVTAAAPATAVGAEDEEIVEPETIPGLDFSSDDTSSSKQEPVPQHRKGNSSYSYFKIPHAKPIPKQFQAQWRGDRRTLLSAPPGENAPDNSNMGPPMQQFPHDNMWPDEGNSRPMDHEMRQPPGDADMRPGDDGFHPGRNMPPNWGGHPSDPGFEQPVNMRMNDGPNDEMNVTRSGNNAPPLPPPPPLPFIGNDNGPSFGNDRMFPSQENFEGPPLDGPRQFRNQGEDEFRPQGGSREGARPPLLSDPMSRGPRNEDVQRNWPRNQQQPEDWDDLPTRMWERDNPEKWGNNEQQNWSDNNKRQDSWNGSNSEENWEKNEWNQRPSQQGHWKENWNSESRNNPDDKFFPGENDMNRRNGPRPPLLSNSDEQRGFGFPPNNRSNFTGDFPNEGRRGGRFGDPGPMGQRQWDDRPREDGQNFNENWNTPSGRKPGGPENFHNRDGPSDFNNQGLNPNRRGDDYEQRPRDVDEFPPENMEEGNGDYAQRGNDFGFRQGGDFPQRGGTNDFFPRGPKGFDTSPRGRGRGNRGRPGRSRPFRGGR